jgi:hypothetical protein
MNLRFTQRRKRRRFAPKRYLLVDLWYWRPYDKLLMVSLLLIQVIATGGLHVVGTERHESRRIDNQVTYVLSSRICLNSLTNFCSKFLPFYTFKVVLVIYSYFSLKSLWKRAYYSYAGLHLPILSVLWLLAHFQFFNVRLHALVWNIISTLAINFAYSKIVATNLLPYEEKDMGQYCHFRDEICNLYFSEAIGIYVHTYRCCKSAKTKKKP